MKKMTALSLGLISLSALTLGGTLAFATAEQPQAESEATVLFKADDGAGGEGGQVVDPPFPGENNKPGIVDEEGSDGNKGDGTKSFNITWVSNFRFNERNAMGNFEPINLNANGMNLWAKGTTLTLAHEDTTTSVYENMPNFVQVVDNRGKLSGWHLNVVATPFTGKNAANQTVTLTGATLSLNQPSTKGPNEVTAPTTFANKVAVNDSAKTIMSAPAGGAGIGTWSLKFGQEETDGTLVEGTGVNLDIPASAGIQADVTYTSNLTWTLIDAPGTVATN